MGIDARILDERKAKPVGVPEKFSQIFYKNITVPEFSRSNYPSEKLCSATIEGVHCMNGKKYNFIFIGDMVVPRLNVSVKGLDESDRDDLCRLALMLRRQRTGGYISVEPDTMDIWDYHKKYDLFDTTVVGYQSHIILTDAELEFDDGETNQEIARDGGAVDLLTREGIMSVNRMFGNTENPCQVDRNRAAVSGVVEKWDELFRYYNCEPDSKPVVNNLVRSLGKRRQSLPPAMKVDQKAVVDFVKDLHSRFDFRGATLKKLVYGDIALDEIKYSALPKKKISFAKDGSHEVVDIALLQS